MKIYLVGGAVRDGLLQRTVKDRDWVVVGASVAQMLAQGYKKIGKDFPVFLHPVTKEEYALARTERKTALGYHGFQFNSQSTVTLEEDLLRRDLTVNALAQDEKGKIIDPYGGQKDLNYRILRHVSMAFAEDPVRILRVARFAARYANLGFKIAAETMKLMQQMVVNGEVDALVAERVWQETVSALKEDSPDVFFNVLRQCGALKKLFPEIDALFGIPQVAKYHPEIDCGLHTMMVLQQAVKLSNQTVTRFAALTHDLGKATTEKKILPHHYKHEKRSLKLIQQLCQRYKVPKKYQQLAEKVAQYHTHIHKAFELNHKTLLKVLQACDAFRQPERFEQLLLACKADSRGRLGFENVPYPQVEFYQYLREACYTVDIQAIIAKGYQGKEIAEQLRRQRLVVIRNIKRKHNEKDWLPRADSNHRQAD